MTAFEQIKILAKAKSIKEIARALKIVGAEKNKVDENEKWRCLECDEIRIGDARVEAGMKCTNCAYGI